MQFRRKPGEPIYLRGQMASLLLAVIAPVVLLILYERFIGPLGYWVRLLAVVGIAVTAGIALFLFHRSSARNEP